MSLKKKRRVQIILVAVVGLALATGLIGYAMQDGINFFRSPTQVTEAPPKAQETFRIGGLVEEASVPVTYNGLLPDLFKEGEGMIGSGRLVDGTFQATEILAKHDEEYMPVEVIDALKAQGVYQEDRKTRTEPVKNGAGNGT